jgi:hypothetical protein
MRRALIRSVTIVLPLLVTLALPGISRASYLSISYDFNARNITATSATVELESLFPATATLYYGSSHPSNCVGLPNTAADSGFSASAHTFRLTGLQPNTTYYYALDSGGELFTNNGACFTFSTLPATAVPTAPLVVTGMLTAWPSCSQPLARGRIIVQMSRSGSASWSNSTLLGTATTGEQGTYAVNVVPDSVSSGGSLYVPAAGDTISVASDDGAFNGRRSVTWDGTTNPIVIPSFCPPPFNVANLLLDPGFEVSPQGSMWQLKPGTTIDTTPANAKSFSQSLLMTTTGTESSPDAQQSVYVAPNTRYEISGWVSQDTANAGVISVYDMSTGTPTTQLASTATVADTGAYRLLTATFTAGPSVTRIQVQANATVSGAHVHMDDLLLLMEPGQLGNGGAEATTGWSGSSWTQNSSTASIASSGCHGGSRCFEVSGASSPSAINQAIGVSPNVPYLVSAWVKQDTASNAFIAAYDDDGRALTNPTTSALFGETGAWYLQQFVVTAHASGMMIFLGQSGAGTSYFDDVSVVAMPGMIGNGGFETVDLPGEGWVLPPNSSIDTAPADAHTGSQSLLNIVTAASGQDAYQDVPVFAGMQYTLSAYLKQTAGTSGGSLNVLCTNGLTSIAQSTVPGTPPATYAPQTKIFTVPSTCTMIRVTLAHAQTGTYSWDDVTLTPQAGKLGNTGFDQDTAGAGWVLPYRGQITTAGALSGNALSNAGSASRSTYAYQDLPVTASTAYTFSMQVNGPAHYIVADCIPSYGATSGATLLGQTSSVTTASYQSQSLSVTTPATGCPYVRVFLQQAAGVATDTWDSGSGGFYLQVHTRHTAARKRVPAVTLVSTNPTGLGVGAADTVHVVLAARPANLPDTLPAPNIMISGGADAPILSPVFPTP